MAYSGFCIGGVDWSRPEVLRVADPSSARAARRAAAREEAAMASSLGGNLLRVFYAAESLLEGGGIDYSAALGTWDPGPTGGHGVYNRSLDERLAALDRCDDGLARAQRAADRSLVNGLSLSFDAVDDIVAGVEEHNTGVAAPERAVRLLLTLVVLPPRWLVEAPSAPTLQAHGRAYTFDSLWGRFIGVHKTLHRRLVERYIGERLSEGRQPAVAAFEVGNEPDYTWTPEEVKIEGAVEPLVYPLGKYVTELQLSQVPEAEQTSPAFERTAWGFADQDAEWAHRRPARRTPVLDFDWGPKFDWYVKCFADLHVAIADELRAAAARAGAAVDIVSGSVTHNNLDYLVRMQRANPRSFASVTKVGIHPYHWRGNDVWNSQFVDPATPMDGWMASSPREFAGDYFKRFDFLEQVARMLQPHRKRWRRETQGTKDLAKALQGRKLWITEFGIGTKTLGAHNTPVAEHTRFIRSRFGIGSAAGHGAAIWEDLWEAFLDQVRAEYLRRHQVECLLLYALREAGLPGYDMDDDDRSNLAILYRDGTSRMDGVTLKRVSDLLGALATDAPQRPPPPRDKSAELHRRPWRSIALPERASNVVTMLSVEERQLLYWLTANYFTGAGAIVDAGCFLGGSTLALGEGLRANARHGRGAHIDVFDLFEVESYMVESYFSGTGLKAGDSFRPLFEENTAPIRDLLAVHAGDFARQAWGEQPIEILFVDIAKSWSLNDRVIELFFPRLIPGRSVLVQQDFAFAFSPWVVVAMEHLAEYFEPVAFAEYNSVVYVCRKPLPERVPEAPLNTLPAAEKIRLVERAMQRFRGYPRSYLECAKSLLLAEAGDLEAAGRELASVRERYPGDELALQHVSLVETSLTGAASAGS